MTIYKNVKITGDSISWLLRDTYPSGDNSFLQEAFRKTLKLNKSKGPNLSICKTFMKHNNQGNIDSLLIISYRLSLVVRIVLFESFDSSTL